MKINKKMYRPAIILAALAAVVLVLSACGADDEDSVDAGSATDDGATTDESDPETSGGADADTDPDDEPSSDDPGSDNSPSSGDDPADEDDDADPSDDEASPSGDDGDTEQTLPPLGAGPYPIATLEISIGSSESDATPISYTVSCLGDTATVTPAIAGLSEQSACELLNDPAVRTRLIDGPDPDLMCTQIYGGPEEARITGTIDDQRVDTVITRTDGCGINDWDVLLAGILPGAGAT